MISKFVNSSINEMSLNLLILQSSISFKLFRAANSCKLLFEFQRSANFSKFILYKNEKSVSLIPLKDNDLSLGSWLTELFIWKTEKSKEYTPRKNFGSYLNLIVNTWGCELLIYRRYSRKNPTCLRLPLYWICGM